MGSMEQEVVQAMPRLLSKVHTGSVSILDRFPLDKLPSNLALIGKILNQFDQTMFNILMFSTNFALLTRNFLMENPDPFVIFYPLDSSNDDGPVSADTDTYQHLKTAFGDATDLSFEEFEQIMGFSANRLQLQLFCQAFAAVWLRDYGETVEISPSGLVNHLRALFTYEKMSERERANVDQLSLKQSTQCVRHILVTFTHMASKDYERITRSG